MSWKAMLHGKVVATALVLAAACTSTSSPDKAENLQKYPVSTDTFRIVDCRLPDRVEKLGSRAVILVPGSTIKTNVRDCELRGGLYVAYDRADYATALRYWMREAQQGDPVAQTSVGELFERGPGGSPDYQAAAEWYRRAAEQGYSRAATNLGMLYERGLGVTKDPQQAIIWYRRAAGLPALSFDVESSKSA